MKDSLRDPSSGVTTHPDDEALPEKRLSTPSPDSPSQTSPTDPSTPITRPAVPAWRITISVFLLFLNYFLAQYDKFILSYFQSSVIASLDLSFSEYSILSGYATGIVYALLALPMAYVADYTSARVWVLSIAATWWSLCVVFQGLSHNFWQILLARIGMGLGQAPVEALSVSLISDLMGKEWVFLGGSFLYVGVYVGEAVSGQIATSFARTNTPWNTALIAIGIVGIVVAILVRLILREPVRQTSLLQTPITPHDNAHHHTYHPDSTNDAEYSLPPPSASTSKLSLAKHHLLATTAYALRLRSFWLLTLSASFRQLSGNVFGYYMIGYLSALFPNSPQLPSRYGIIVGVVGSFAVLFGGFTASFFATRGRPLVALYMTALGGMISAIFVLLMIFSRAITPGSSPTAPETEPNGLKTLYAVMTLAYLFAETWLGAFNALLVLLLPPRYKTFALALYQTTLVLIYSSGPQIIGLALRGLDPESETYVRRVRVVLAVIIPAGYWIAGVGFLCAVRLVWRDLRGGMVPKGGMSRRRRGAFRGFVAVLAVGVVTLFVCSLLFR
ncbi:MAG: hypothetical protein M1817_006121 [Caeruleum heppii]|nr:MAG: hypothetical protein M1817_006121 [Caeruleum heppii]